MLAIAIVALVLISTVALAQEKPSLCTSISIPHGAIMAHDGTWIELAPVQRAFVDGIYAMAPTTPQGLPWGDKIVLATIPGNPGAIAFFIDGDQACTPMPIPAILLDMILDVGKGTIHHEKDGM